MFVLWTLTWNKNGKIPSIWEDLYKLLKKEPFSNSMQIQKKKKNTERVEENDQARIKNTKNSYTYK